MYFRQEFCAFARRQCGDMNDTGSICLLPERLLVVAGEFKLAGCVVGIVHGIGGASAGNGQAGSIPYETGSYRFLSYRFFAFGGFSRQRVRNDTSCRAAGDGRLAPLCCLLAYAVGGFLSTQYIAVKPSIRTRPLHKALTISSPWRLATTSFPVLVRFWRDWPATLHSM